MCIGRVLMILGNGFEPDPRVLAEGRALVRAGHSVRIVAWDRSGRMPRRAIRDGIRVRRFGPRSRDGRGRGQAAFAAGFAALAVAAGSRERYDLVWGHDLDALPAALALGRVRGRPVVYDAHESYPDMVAESVGPVVAGALRALERRLVRRADAVVTVGERLADHLETLGARRVVVAGNWKDPADFRQGPAERGRIRAALGVPEDAFLVSSIGWLGVERQLPALLAAVAAEEDVWLLVAGRGPLMGICRRAAACCPRVRFPGWVDGDRVPELTACSDAVFYGFDPANGNARFSAPNKLFEALAAGRPVLTGPFGEIGDIVARNGCGVVLPDYRPVSIRTGLGEVRRGAGFAAAARRAGRRFHRGRADRALVELVRDLLPRGVAAATAPEGAPA